MIGILSSLEPMQVVGIVLMCFYLAGLVLIAAFVTS